jgi:hypothetical protein
MCCTGSVTNDLIADGYQEKALPFSGVGGALVSPPGGGSPILRPLSTIETSPV